MRARPLAPAPEKYCVGSNNCQTAVETHRQQGQACLGSTPSRWHWCCHRCGWPRLRRPHFEQPQEGQITWKRSLHRQRSLSRFPVAALAKPSRGHFQRRFDGAQILECIPGRLGRPDRQGEVAPHRHGRFTAALRKEHAETEERPRQGIVHFWNQEFMNNSLPPAVRQLASRYRTQADSTRRSSHEMHNLHSLSQRLLLSPEENARAGRRR